MKIEIPWYWLLRPWVVCGMQGTARIQPMSSQDLVYHPLKGLNIGEHLENDAYRWQNAATLLMSVGPETREVVRTLLKTTWAYGNLGSGRSWPPTDAEIKDTYAPTCWPRDWGFEVMKPMKPIRAGELRRVSEVDSQKLQRLAQDLAKEEGVPVSEITIHVCGTSSHVHDSKGPQVSSEDGSWMSASCSQCGSLAIDRIGEMP